MQSGVEGYVICNKQGQVLRRYPQMSLDDAEKYAESMISLTNQARGVVRDLNPKVKRDYDAKSAYFTFMFQLVICIFAYFSRMSCGICECARRSKRSWWPSVSAPS